MPSCSRRTLLRTVAHSGLALGAATALVGCSTAPHGSPTSESDTGSQAPQPHTGSAAPEVAESGASFVLAQRSVGPQPRLPDQKGALLAGPHLTALVRRAAFSPTLPAATRRMLGQGADTDAQDLACPDGHQWLLLTLQPSATFTPARGHQADCALRWRGGDLDIAGELGSFSQHTGFSTRILLVAVAVPDAGALTLTLTDEDRTATLDLRTLKTGDDAGTRQMMQVAGRTRVDLSKETLTWKGGWSDGTTADTASFTLTIDPADVTFSPWIGSWAGRGRCFLRFRLKTSYRTANNYTFLELPADAFTLSSADGATYRNRGGKVTLLTSGVKAPTLLFEVPADVAGGTLTVDVPDTYRVTYQGGARRTLPLRGSGDPTTRVTVRRS